MTNLVRTLSRVSRGRLVGVLSALLLVMVVAEPVIGPLVGLAVVGGSLIAGGLALVHRINGRASAGDAARLDDPSLADPINFARVRVAGVGGFGLVLIAILVALEFDLAFAVLAAGLTGGFLGACYVIYRRRRRGPLDSSSRGPSARVFLSVKLPNRDRDDSLPPGIRRSSVPGRRPAVARG